MMDARELWGGPISVIDYRCGVGPGERPFVERHDGFSPCT
jgi:hypothetical protein